MKQSDHPHGLEENEVSVFISFKRETNPAGHVFSFERKNCAHCFKWLGDSSPMLVKEKTLVYDPAKRIAIQKMTCGSKNRCEEGAITVYLRDEMDDPENIIGKYCENCKQMIWGNKNIFPYTAENLGACQV